MPLHLIKLCVGCDSSEELAGWIKQRMKQRKARGERLEHIHTTRMAPKRADDQALRAALAPLLGKIDIAAMREANLRAASGDGASSPDAVARWLWEKIEKP